MPLLSIARFGTCEIVLLIVRLTGAEKVAPRSCEAAKKISGLPGVRSSQATETFPFASATIVDSFDSSTVFEIFCGLVKLAPPSDEAEVKISKRLSLGESAVVIATNKLPCPGALKDGAIAKLRSPDAI